MEITTYNANQTKSLAKQIAKQTKKGDILCLYGDLGSGKTTFTKYLVQYLGISSKVQSPTFVIHRVYQKDELVVHHFDLYRISDKAQLHELDLEEFLEENESICFIEWPQIALEVLKKYEHRVKNIKIEFIEGEVRKFIIN